MEGLTFEDIALTLQRTPDFPPELLNEAISKFDQSHSAALVNLLKSSDPGVVLPAFHTPFVFVVPE